MPKPRRVQGIEPKLRHQGVLTTLYSHGDVPDYRQAELIKRLNAPRLSQSADMETMLAVALEKFKAK